MIRLVFTALSLPQLVAYLSLAVYTSMYPTAYMWVAYGLLALFIVANVLHTVMALCNGMGVRIRDEYVHEEMDSKYVSGKYVDNNNVSSKYVDKYGDSSEYDFDLPEHSSHVINT